MTPEALSLGTGEAIVALVMGLALVAYAVTGGADYGAGVWDLLARGKDQQAIRGAVERAIAPIWEANHVWLIFLVVLLFTTFPLAFSVIATALHIPITLALIGIVLRGAAFVMRAYGLEAGAARARWGRVFGLSSLLTPILLGVSLAAVSTGDIRVVDGVVTTGFIAGWTTSFAWATGAFALALFSYLAAVYLAAENDGATRAAFVRRAHVAHAATAAVALIVLQRASVDAPELFANLVGARGALPVFAATVAAGALTVWWLHRNKARRARWASALQVALIVVFWGVAMDGHAVLPDVPLYAGGARPEVTRPLLPALGIGALVLAPALWWLFRVFKGKRAAGSD